MRIIYKIKSSWDFISSVFKINTKRRWNSKMAISIKNHEDRITALENISHSSVVENIYDKTTVVRTSFTLNKPMTAYDILIFNMNVNASYYEGCYVDTVNNIRSLKRDIFISGTATGCHLRYLNDTTIQVISNECSGSFMVIGLKLYYNFSYNITREFYKVKFKLRHYLCSHLQNYASNKGGVIQNGY